MNDQTHDFALPDTLTIARDVLARGYKPLPIPIGAKNPILRNWQNLFITAENVTHYFNGAPQNVGAQLGPVSGGLADVDLDCIEAVRLAPHFLPATRSIYGRLGKRRSHYLYICSDPDPKATIKLLDDAKQCIVELRLGGGGKGAQSVMPGSIHTSGERYEWDEDSAPGAATCVLLKTGIVKIAVGVLLVRHWPAKSRHDACLCVGGFLARCEWTPDAIGEFIVAVQEVAGVADTGHIENGRQAAVDAATAHVADGKSYGLPTLIEFFGDAVAKRVAKILGYRERGEPTSDDGRPVLKVVGGQLSGNADKAEEILIAAGVPFFERSNKLVRPIVKDVDTFRGNKTSVAQLAAVSETYMRDMLGRMVAWYKFDLRAKRWVPVDPPRDVAGTILERAGEWKFPSVAGIITAQTMRPDGTILDQPGYDPTTRLLLVNPPQMKPIPDEPSEDEARTALELLESLLAEFPLVDDVAKSVALSTLITPVVRGAFSVAPMHIADAPVAGSGKSYLFDTAAVIAIGQPMPVIAAGCDEEELEKRLGAALLAGHPLITIDNVNRVLESDALCQIIERPRPQVRILGKSELIDVETRGTTLFANGNNICVSGDLCRRVVRTRLDPKMENPELKTFKGNPVATVLADRGAYIAAALTVCRAYIVAGRPHLAPRLASFEGWSDTVRSALIWLGKHDPISSMEAFRAEDPERARLRALLTAWVHAFGTGEANSVTAKQVIERSQKMHLTNLGAPVLKSPELSAAVHAVAGGGGRTPDSVTLGQWLGRHKNRVIDAMWFAQDTSPKDAIKWYVDTSSPDDL
jgi:Bifunctional DNA primase/polymerase, N-terminal